MRHIRRLAASVTCLAVLFVALNGLVPIGSHQAQPGHGKFNLDDVTLAGPAVPARPPAGGQPGAKGALALAPSAPSDPGPGWSARIEVPDHPLMVALSWQGHHDGQIQLRTSDGTSFGDWVDVEGSTNHGPDQRDPNKGKGLTSTDPVWLGTNVSEVEVKVAKGTLPGLELTKFNWQGTMPSSGSAGFGTDIAGAEPAQPAIHPRSAWDGGNGWRSDIAGCGSGPQNAPELKMAIVHHTVNANDYSQADVPLLIRGIYQWHTDHNGWCDIGYNFLVDKFGGVWQGRSGDMAMPVWGGHAIGFNYRTMGVALLGAYQPGASPPATQPSPAMIGGLVNLIAWKFGIHGIDPLGTTQYVAGAGSHWPDGTTVTLPTIVGHRDTSSTECPGDFAEDLLPSIRQQVANRLAATKSPVSTWRPFPDPRWLVYFQYRDILYRDADNAHQAWWANQMITYGHNGPWVATSMIGSPETQQTLVPMIRLYFAVFNRWADYGGLGLWVNQLQAGHSLSWVGDQFAKSPEYEQRYGNTTDKQFVDLLYRNVLHRQPDQAGEQAWIDHLQKDHWTRGQVVIGFSESTENKMLKVNETNVGQVYYPMLHRAPDLNGFFWAVDNYNHGGLIRVVTDVWSSREYAQRFGG